jgi:hypothetical protein
MFAVKLQARILVTMLIVFAPTILSSCVPERLAPERSFTTKELLIGLSDMPPGWEVSWGPEKSKDYISTHDSFAIAFIVNDANLPFGRRGALHAVYRYRSARAAEGIYKDVVLPGQVGKMPGEWTYQSPIADQSHFACYDYEGREPYPVCEWSARYEEYIVDFFSWLIPGYMSLEDMERVVRAIDARMAHYLGKPLPTQEP